MALIDIETPKPQKRQMNRNFEGPRLLVHKIGYTLIPDGQMKTAHICAENFIAAERVLIANMPKGQRFNINNYSDTEFEVCAFSPVIEKQLYKSFQNKFDPLTDENIKKRLK